MCDDDNLGGRLGRKLGNMGFSAGERAFNRSVLGKTFKRAKKWFGNGDYTINTNSIIDNVADPGDLQTMTNGSIWTDFIYREYLGDILAPVNPSGFNVTAYDINPGLVQLHPWLAPIAQQFEQYEPMGIIFEYKSLLSDFSSNQVLGSVMMATDYDPVDANYATKQELMNSQYSSQAKPTESLLHGIECDETQRPNKLLYVRSGTLPANDDIRDYDLGQFQIATQGLGVAAHTPIGSLYVHYHYRFYKQQLSNGLLQRGQLSSLFSNFSVAPNYTPWDSTHKTWKWNSIGLTLEDDGFTVKFPPQITSGSWLIVWWMQANGGIPAGSYYIDEFHHCVQAKNVLGDSWWNTSPSTGNMPVTDGWMGEAVVGEGCQAAASTSVLLVTGPNATFNLHVADLIAACFHTFYVVNVSNFDTV